MIIHKNNTFVEAIITFSNGNDKFDATITQVKWYDDTSTVDAIRKMLLAEEIKAMLPNVQHDDINTAVSVYLKMNRQKIKNFVKTDRTAEFSKIRVFHIKII